jgi:RNA recognition motif-containing protein
MARRGGKNKTGRKSGGGKSSRTDKGENVASASSPTPTSRSVSSLTASNEHKNKKSPLIAFFGQLSFDTTREDLKEHICTQLLDTRFKVSDQTIKIRMLTDPKTLTFRGMAFVQVNDNADPEFLYALLKLHQTYLKGRRINVERSAGGRKNSESRQGKLEQFKREQTEYFVKVVDSILQEFQARGEIRKDELDDGVITLCRRHSGPVVKAAITEYVEKGGGAMDNPSAYLSFLVAKFAKEGIRDEEVPTKKRNLNDRGVDTRKRKSTDSKQSDNNKRRIQELTNPSALAQSDVDMSISDSTRSCSKNRDTRSSKDFSKSFPLSQRGKGRGYMRNVR